MKNNLVNYDNNITTKDNSKVILTQGLELDYDNNITTKDNTKIN